MGHVDVARAGGRGPYWYVHWVFASRDALADSETQNRLKIAKLRILRSILYILSQSSGLINFLLFSLVKEYVYFSFSN